jgi:hypothetical protein
VAACLVTQTSQQTTTAVSGWIGFAKDASQNWALLSRSPELSARLQRPILVGASRKRFLRRATGTSVLDAATASVSALAALAGAKCVRVHDVAWALAERGAPRGLRRLPKPSSSRPYRGWVARCKTSSSQFANLALAHLRLLVGAAAQVAEARTGFLDAQDER